MKKFQILIFGASGTHGNWDEQGGWAERLRRRVIKGILTNPNKFHGHVFNLGVPGDTTAVLLARMENEIKSRLFYLETIIIISVGVNDSRIKNSDKKPLITEEEFVANQEKLLKLAKKYTDKVLFVGYNPVDENRTAPWDECYTYRCDRIIKCNNIVKSICAKNKADFVDVYPLIESKDIYDGLHPNSSGHKKIYEQIWPYLEKFLK